MQITFPLPPTTNNTYRVGNGRMYKSNEASDWQQDAFYHIKETIHPRYSGKVHVDVTFYIKRGRDVDGAVKPILDVLQQAQVVKNDSQVVRLSVCKELDLLNPRVEVSIHGIT